MDDNDPWRLVLAFLRGFDSYEEVEEVLASVRAMPPGEQWLVGDLVADVFRPALAGEKR